MAEEQKKDGRQSEVQGHTFNRDGGHPDNKSALTARQVATGATPHQQPPKKAQKKEKNN